MAARSWRWLVVRIQGLLTHPTRMSRLAAALAPPPDEPPTRRT